MDETLTEIMELTVRGQGSHERMRDLLDSLTGRELKILELNVRELQRQNHLAQCRKGVQGF